MKSRRNWIWFFIKLLPLIYIFGFMICYMLVFQQTGTAFSVTTLRTEISNLSGTFSFSPVTSVLYDVFEDITGTSLSGNYNLILIPVVIRYISYLVFVEIFRIMYEVLVFLPKFANSFFERKLGD